MKAPRIDACDLQFDAEGIPVSPRYGDRYHPRTGAAEQAQRVFLAGNGLPERWRGRRQFHIVETGFGIGWNFLTTWRAWLDDPDACARLSFVSIERHPPSVEQLRQALPADHPLALRLIAAWPPLVPGLHRLGFEDGGVELLLCFGDAGFWARERTGLADAFYLDGFAPARNPDAWQPVLLQALLRRAQPDATAATWSVARDVRDGLSAAGFDVERRPGVGTKRERLVARRRATLHPGPLDQRLQAVEEPPHPDRDAEAANAAPRPVSKRSQPLGGQRVLVIGAGLAGSACTHALLESGATVTLVDRRDSPAQETSGNPAGLVHGVFHVPDSPHARLHRAAALDAWREIRRLARRHPVPHGQGLLRLQAADDAAAMQAELDASGMPPEYLQVLDGAAVAGTTGLPGPWPPAWFYPGGGWVDPSAVCRAWLTEAAHDRFTWRGNAAVASLETTGSAWWARLGPQPSARTLDETVGPFDAVVVAAAGAESLRLLAPHSDAADWPMQPIRGQIMAVDAGSGPTLRVAVAGRGYAVPLPDGRVLVGSTSQPGDADPTPREPDDALLWQIASAFGLEARPEAGGAGGAWRRAGVRWSTDDRLPVIGRVVFDGQGPSGMAVRLDQARFVPRVPGLFVHTALGSRGIAWAHWGARLVVASMLGGPAAAESSLLDRVDPARFRVRAARRGSSSQGA